MNASTLDTADIQEVVMRLIGPIRPVGETNADNERLANIKVLTNLVDRLLFEIISVAHNADRQEASMKKIGAHARDFLKDVKEADLA